VSSTFTEVWDQLDEKRSITGSGKDIKMTPEQFKKMLRQFYDIGHKHGSKEGYTQGMKSAKGLQDILNKGSSNPFADIDGLSNIFGGNK
jgi:hypothetical protein